jgi:hypothetical protein
MIKKTKVVTFPRSGHHLLVRGLQWALQNELVYSEGYESPHNMDNCEFVNLQKTHDFELTEPIEPEMNYLVQIRPFELAVESWYKMLDHGVEFDVFRESKVKYFDDFMEKWVLSNLPNVTVIAYNDLVSDKVGTLVKAYKAITDIPLDSHRLDLIRKWERAEITKKCTIFAT